jgi:CRISPR-associated protein Csm1
MVAMDKIVPGSTPGLLFANIFISYHKDNDTPLHTKEAWEEHKFLLIQGDFFGIQQFIFSGSEENSKKVAKQLRGKSASVSLMMELAALKVVETLGLSRVSIVQNMAGKFLIIAGNTKENREKLAELEEFFNRWFLEKSYGQAGIILADITASCHDFSSKNLSSVLKQMAEEMEFKKSQKFHLLTHNDVVFTDYLKSMEGREPCRACAIHPIEKEEQCEMCNFFTYFGQKLASPKTEYLYIYRHHDAFDLFGYEIGFSYDPHKELIAKWDISLPDRSGYRFKGEAVRTLKAYIPLDEKEMLPKEFSDLAKSSDGQKALSVLKADVDNLGTLFIERLPKSGEMSFARYNMTARLINHFFTVKLAHLMQNEFQNIYAVFAGGDDLFVIDDRGR